MKDQIQTLVDADEVIIETRLGDRIIPTVIWVVACEGELFVRSFLGASARWFQRAKADPHVVLRVNEVSVEFTAVPAVDPESVLKVSQGFIEKYRPGANRDAMVRSEIAGTTLRLEPRP